jgi:uncharacterized protein
MSKAKVTEFCWNELATPNVDAAKDFYGKLLGWKFTDHPMDGTIYTLVTSGEKEAFAGIWHIPPEKRDQVPPHWMAYILVDNADSTLEKAKTLGAEVVVPVTQAGDKGRFAVIKDPTGAHIAFWEPAK